MSAMCHPSDPAIAPRRSAGIRPARTTDDLPLPLGPTTARKRVCFTRLTSSSTSSSRPKKSTASPSSNARSPLYGFATIAPGTAGARPTALAPSARRNAMSSAASFASARSRITCTGSASPLRWTGPRSTYATPSTFLARCVTAGLARISAGGGDPAQTRREVERSAPVAALDGTASPASSPIPTASGSVGSATVSSTKRRWSSTEARIACRGRVEDRERLVTAELHDGPAAGLDALARHDGELACQGGRGLVAALLGEDRVAADIGDQERPDVGAVPASPRRPPWALP